MNGNQLDNSILIDLSIETPSCNLCGEMDSELMISGRDRLHHFGGLFKLVRCKKCGLIYLSPRPSKEAIGKYYPDDYIAFAQFEPQNLSPLARWDRQYGIRKCAREIMKYRASGSILDVGCAVGNFLAYMKDRGWKTHGVEISATAARIARSRGLDIEEAELTSAGFNEKQFDVVTFWDVLEHVHDPMANLLEVHRILKDDGVLVFGVPNAQSYEAKIFQKYWAGLDVPRHLYVFPVLGLVKLLGKAGFEVASMKCLNGTYGSHALSLRFFLDEKLGESKLKDLVTSLVANPLVRALAVPYFRIIDMFLRGSKLTVVAKKSFRD